jgi:hypothetical protein
MSGDAPLVDAYGRDIRLVRRKKALYVVLVAVYVAALALVLYSAPWAELVARWKEDQWGEGASTESSTSPWELGLVFAGAWLYSILITALAYFDLVYAYGPLGSPYTPVMVISLSIVSVVYMLVRLIIGFDLSRTLVILGVTMVAFLAYLVIDRHVSEW